MNLIKTQLSELVFAGGCARMRALDCSAKVQCRLSQRPQSLRAFVGVMLGSGRPALVRRGPAYTSRTPEDEIELQPQVREPEGETER